MFHHTHPHRFPWTNSTRTTTRYLLPHPIAIGQVQEAVDPGDKALSLGQELPAEIKRNQGFNLLDVQTEMSHGPEAKETTIATVEERPVTPGDDKQRQDDGGEYEQS